MIDPLLSLAISMTAPPGVFALLIGSGVSRKASIKTGWEITLDLAGRVAAGSGDDPGPDAADWFGRRFGREPRYSDLLTELSKSPAVRAELLRPFFEPTAEERAQGLKLPTAAHVAIADLVASGHIKLIITTNFDRLIETALEARGISAVVVSTPDAIAGGPPPVHSPITIVKLHGDYREPSRMLNTEPELASYDPRVEAYLDRVIEDYGWIVVGWSGEWDGALRAAFERSLGRRYPMFWASRHDPTGLAKNLVTLRGADVIRVADAETFLPELAERVKALRAISRPHPLSAAAAVARAKRYITEGRTIQLNDLVVEETEQTFRQVGGDNLGWSGSITFSPDTVRPRVAKAEAATEVLAAVLATGAFWGAAEHRRILVRALERLVNPRPGTPTYFSGDLSAEFLPAVIALYAAGIGAVAGSRFATLRAIFLDPRIHTSDGDVPLASRLAPGAALSRQVAQFIEGMNGSPAPLSAELERYLRGVLADLLPGEDEFREAFDRFEYLLALTCADLKLTSYPDAYPPLGLFAWRGRTANAIAAELQASAPTWPPIQEGGLFDHITERAVAAQSVIAQRLGRRHEAG